MNTITIEDIRKMDASTKKLIDRCMKLTRSQLDLVLRIAELTEGRPDRLDYAIEYLGKRLGRAEDLPAALAQI